MHARPLALLIACGLAFAGCGGDDGLRTEDVGIETPAEAAPAPEAVPPLAEPGLLAPQKRPAEKKKRRKRDKAADKQKAKQGVAGVTEQNVAVEAEPVEAPATTQGSLGAPDPDPVDAEGMTLSAQQRNDLESVRATLREFFTRMNARDSEICTELLTQRHVEEATGLTGQAAVDRCRADVAGSTTDYGLNKISGVRIQGDFALIRFASSIGDYARWEIFRAQRSGAGWRFDGNGSADV